MSTKKYDTILQLTGSNLSIEDVVSVAREGRLVAFSEEAEANIKKSYECLSRWVQEGRVMYGITTGFGSMASTLIPPTFQGELQRNLVRSHSVNVGPALPSDEVRAAMLLRLNAFAKGVSGISLETTHTLLAMLNKGVHPRVPQWGSVGASGDLTPLAHIALTLIGEGFAEYQGEVISSGDALARAGLTPVTLQAKEGLALINGVSVMTGIGTLALYDGNMMIKTAEIVSALCLEAATGTLEPFQEFGQLVKPHPGQLHTARNIRNLLQGSVLVTDGNAVQELHNKWQATMGAQQDTTTIDRAVQDGYSLRAVAQIIGALRDAIRYVEERLTTEINSVSDNPLIFPDRNALFQGAQFHGATVALPLDVLTIAAVQVGVLAERQLNRLLNRHLSNGLPPFLISGIVGVRCGFEGAQYVATSLVAECRTLAVPASIQSIPSNEDNQDVVSMGLIAARKARDTIEKVEYILAVTLLAACQGLEERGAEKGGPVSRALHRKVREHIPVHTADRPMSGEFEIIRTMIRSGEFVSVAETTLGETL